ncbi:MAG: protein kinase [Cyanobacteria bacterium SZAS-4]|nr:protein kinase [Cyanobacteria bacterium SZAS-4]
MPTGLTTLPEDNDAKRDAFIGRTLADRYQVESIIGTGGMGVVYKAWQENLKRAVAVKVLRHQFLNDESSVKRFQQEAVAASRLAHPHIVALHDYGSTEDGFLFMVMDIIDGKSLAQEEREKKTIGVERSIKIIAQVCDALEHAHRNGIVHRDLKPGNIMLTNFQGETDYVKLVDFGIAKVLVKEEDQELTQKGEVFGSPLYMSPEQCLGQDLDGRSDIYSLGAVMYEALTGFVPHIGRNAIETIDMQIHKAPLPFATKRPDIYIPERLETVVLKALAKDPAERQQSMKALAMELEAAVPRKNQSSGMRAIDPTSNSTKNKPVNRVAVVSGVIAVLAVAGLGLKYTVASTPSNTVPSGIAPITPVTTQELKTVIPTPTLTAPKVPETTATTTPTSSMPQTSRSTVPETPPGNLLTKPISQSTTVKPKLLPHRKIAQPKPAAAKVAKPKRDPWAQIENRIKKTSSSGNGGKSAKTSESSRWSHMEHMLPVSP